MGTGPTGSGAATSRATVSRPHIKSPELHQGLVAQQNNLRIALLSSMDPFQVVAAPRPAVLIALQRDRLSHAAPHGHATLGFGHLRCGTNSKGLARQRRQAMVTLLAPAGEADPRAHEQLPRLFFSGRHWHSGTAHWFCNHRCLDALRSAPQRHTALTP